MRRIIITWASEWLWYELSKLYLKNWFEVVGISRTKPDIDIVHVEADLTKHEDLDTVISRIQSDYSEFEALVNCAGMMVVQELSKLDYKENDTLMKLNVLAPIYLTGWLIENIKTNEADIINVASTVWLRACKDQCSYSASKWAMRWVSENFKLELQDTNSRVVWFNIGWFKSKISEKATWISVDLSPYMDPADIAVFMKQILDLPKTMEVSAVTINRKVINK